MKILRSLTFVAVLVGSASAWAQLPPIITSSQPYQSLTGATVLSFASGADDVGLSVPLGFTFTYFGVNYTSVIASTNGVLTFESACSTGCFSNVSFPSSASPNAALAAVWDDMRIGPNTQIRYVQGAGETTIEYFRSERLSGGAETTYSVTFTAGGQIKIHYGSMTVGTTAWTFSAGFENGAGTVGANLFSCTASCTEADFVANRLVQIGEPVNVDLITASVTVDSFTRLPDDNLTFTVNTGIRNIGRSDAGVFEWAAYLSRDRALDITATDGGADILVASGTAPDGLPSVFNGVTADGGQSLVTLSAPAATTVPPPTGEYYVLVLADSTNQVTEESETNNVGSSATAFVQGVDLVATSVSGPTTSVGGADAGVVVNFFNRGTSSPDAGVPFRVLLSNDALLDSTDFPIFNGTRAVSGGQTINETVTFAMPANAPPGEHFYLLQIDPPQAGRPNGVIEEASETNNTAASTGKVTISRSDLVAESVEFLDTVTNLPTLGARFGEPVRMKVRYRNAGQATALNYRIGLVISNDSSLSLLSDTTVCTELVASTPVSTTITELTINCTLPLQNRDGADFTTGLYYLFGQVDVTSAVYETNEQNNSQMVGPVRITAPGADVAVTAVTAPASAGVGEIIPVTRSLRNLGNVNAPEVEYRFYASANNIITTDDVPLSILDGANLRDSSTITLMNGSADTQTELVRLPVTLPAGTYYVGCIIDPARTIGDDLEPGNNALSSRTMVVASSSLRVTNTALPDAIIGRPYSYRLSAAGEQGASTWSIDMTQSRPAWLSIGATDGLLTGTPTGANGAEVVGLTVRVENAGRTAVTRLALRVLPTTSALEVLTTALPAVVNSSTTQYDFTLGAAGGVRPYAWRVASGTLPTGLALNASGTIVGAPRNTPNGTLPITVEVRDAVGGRATRQLSLRLIAPGAITFRTISIPDALIGQEYLQDIAVANQDGSMLAKPLIWRVSGAVPGGLTVTPQAELITVAGRATQAGTFTFAISVEDNNGRTDSLEYTMTVHPSRYRVLASMPEVLRPGESVTIPLSVSPQGTVTYRSVNGALPPGLVVEPSGSISGTVNETGAEGSWSFVIEVKDAAGVSGITPMALRVERLPRAVGCSSTSADWSPLALVFGAALFMFRRRPMRFGVAAALSSLVALVPMAARAQYEVSVTPVVYQPLANGTPTNTTGAISLGSMVFPFFNGTVGSVTMSQYGYLALDGAPSAVSANQNIPHAVSTAPKALIAPWWDVLAVPANTANGYRYQLTGAAPNRVMAFEWNAVGANLAANRVSFQVLLYETTGRIRFVYSTALPGAVNSSVGIMKDTGGVKGLTCTPSCSSAAYPAGQAIDFFRPPDFEITALSAPQVGHAGVAFPQTAIVRNRGGRDATGVAVRFYLSTDAVLDPMVDTVVGSTTINTIEAQGVAQATLNAPLPASLVAGSSHFIFAVVDPDRTIAEESDLNNTSAPQAITIGNPTADLVVTAVSAPTTAMPGATLQASRTFQNVGNAPSIAAKYSWFISDNASVSIADRALHVGELSVLTVGQTDLAMEAVSLPADLAPGSYWLGVCVNYDSATSSFGGSEITIVNNCFTQSAAIQVSTGGVLIATSPLPQATQFAPYGVRLQASGGTGQYTWEFANGVLPPGLTLSTAGDLVGSPSTSGSFAFDVKVTSGALTDTRMLSLQVTAGGLPLVIVPQSLTAAEFGRVYSSSLVAVGGRPPYVWRTTGMGLPPGMGVATDGLLEGRALQSGEFSFEVEVKDSAGTVVTNELSLRVVTPTSLSIATAALSSGLVGREYLQPLVAIGGTAPYAWSLIRFQELPENVTDAPGVVLYDDGRPVAFPAELGLSIDDRDTSDFLSGTPRKAGLYALTFKVKDGLETEDTASVLLRISYRDGLAITTLQLPDAFVGQPYQVRLSHNAGSGAEGIVFSLPCVQQAVRPGEFQCATPDATQQLPAGLMLQPDGVILGTANTEPGVFTFLVKVNDGLGRQDVRAIAIRLRPDFSNASSGCSTAGLPPTTLLALAFGALALRRRRR